jgi:malonate-semialdehyde dehydrogenase (acetylating)/methylmalonate-semialdehyde dehydrogenase
MPYALACGNTYIVKPSEKAPLTMGEIFNLFEEIELPDGVLNMVNGTREVVDTILDHSGIHAISFVGSTDVAKYIYERASNNGKRVQAQGGAKNSVVIMPDCDMESAARIIADSAFGCAGQRCLAASMAITVGKAIDSFKERILEIARNRVVGYGMNENVEMGAVISKESKERIENFIQTGIEQGADLLLDGRNVEIKGFEKGYFLRPTILENVQPGNVLIDTEIFGPVLGLLQVETLDEAIEIINNSKYGNAASIFTGSGSAARKFRNEVQAGNIGINIGIAAPMAFFPFSGWKDSFFGDLHGQSFHAIEFYTQTKVVIEKWYDEWSRKF